MADYSDARLLGELDAGRETALEYVFDRYWSRLYTYAYKFVDDREAAKDIAMESFNTLYLKGRTFESIHQLEAYLYLVTRNKCMDYLRSLNSSKRVEREFSKSFDDSELINDRLDGHLVETLHNALQNLPERARQAVTMYYLHGLSYKQIAGEMAISERTVEAHLRKALERLRTLLETKGLALSVILLLLSMAFLVHITRILPQF